MSKSLKKIVEESRDKNIPEVDMCDRGISNMLDVPGLFTLSNITQLVLSHNKLTAVPPNISGLENLEVLNMFNNQIEELPTQISSLQKLKHLNLGHILCQDTQTSEPGVGPPHRHILCQDTHTPEPGVGPHHRHILCQDTHTPEPGRCLNAGAHPHRITGGLAIDPWSISMCGSKPRSVIPNALLSLSLSDQGSGWSC
ncbi:hypothetical protein WMY93_029770 [Mugilogobius chulae]|uniref:Ras suppressor protein 1 n=1 Tax=Mugilogobius chulae TaxID=88201 RepID=A0AAW0MXL7_9GOBI